MEVVGYFDAVIVVVASVLKVCLLKEDQLGSCSDKRDFS